CALPIFRHPHRHALAAERIDCEHSGVESFLLLLADFATRSSLRSYLLRKCVDVSLQRRTFEQLVEQRMIGRQDHGRRAIDGIDARRKYTNLSVAVLYLEVD